MKRYFDSLNHCLKEPVSRVLDSPSLARPPLEAGFTRSGPLFRVAETIDLDSAVRGISVIFSGYSQHPVYSRHFILRHIRGYGEHMIHSFE